MHDRTLLLAGGTLAAVLVATAAGAVAVRAQDAPTPPEAPTPGSGSHREPDKSPGAPPQAPAVPAAPREDFAPLVKALGDADFAARERAFAKLREAGAAAKPALEEGAKSEDAQVRWSSRRLLRSLEEGRSAPARRWLEFRTEDPQGEARRDDDRGRKEGFLPFQDEAIRQRMAELRDRMKELEKEFDDLPTRVPRIEFFGNAFGVGPQGTVERQIEVERDGERTKIHVDADGKIKVTLARTVDGKPKEETFEAANLEALQKEHPEVHEKVKDLVGGWDGFRVFPSTPAVPAPPGTLRLPRLEFREAGPREQRRALELLAPAKPVLGVTISEVPAVLRTQLSLDPEEGVVVEEVFEGTTAARLGLQRHDVLLSVNGIPVASADDVRASVGAVKEGGDLRIRILRAGQRTELAGVR